MIMATFNNESHPNHFWRRTHLQDGSVVYKNVASNMALSHSRDASVHAIKSLQLSDWHCQWMEQGVGDGFVAIRNRATGMVLDHFGGYTITAFHDDVNCKNRQWMVSTIKSSAAHSPSSMVVIKNRATGKVLDHFYGKSIQAPNSDESHPNHQWRRTQLSDGFVVYTNVASDMTLAHGPVDLVCAVKTLDLHCQWEELDVGSGAVAIRNKATGMVLNHLHGIPIIALDDSLSPSSQQWTIRTLA
ncbi:hypothetical protein HK405_014034 [Cladochytrium tenue]|nr:hypothetical protein HK405_014034 [Cladochytrium tenue]